MTNNLQGLQFTAFCLFSNPYKWTKCNYAETSKTKHNSDEEIFLEFFERVS